MSKKTKRSKKKYGMQKWLWGIFVVVVLILAAVSAVIVHKQNAEKEQAAEKQQLLEQGLEFPYKLEDGKLEVASVFQFTGINPDCNDEEGEDICSIQLKNCSGEYLNYADITVELSDGTKREFRIEDIPSDQSVLAFEVKNQSYDGQAKVIKITAKTSYTEDVSLEEDAISIAEDVSGIHITNISSEELGNIAVKYHCYMDDMYFGGTAYEGSVESLAAGEEVVLEAPECYLGEAAVTQLKLGD